MPPITLKTGEAFAVVAPEHGGWLLRYARHVPRYGWVEALHCPPNVLEEYPKRLYAGNPVLFPTVSVNVLKGRPWLYEWKGRVFQMPLHGFARHRPWKIRRQTDVGLELEFASDATTHGSYPFDFLLTLQYRLDGGRLCWRLVIYNTGSEEMPLSAGFHPYFAAPLVPGSRRNDCYVQIAGATRFTAEGYWERFVAGQTGPWKISLAEDASKTLFFGNFSLPEVAYVDASGALEAVLNFSGAPACKYMAMWAESTTVPFYCLEPWTALPNCFGRTDGELIKLQPGDSLEMSLWMELRDRQRL